MAYGFVAYIDEAGDQGFTFRDPPQRASSQWFILSAVVIRESRRTEEMRAFTSFAQTISAKHWSKLHFRELPHERRAAITHYLSRRPIRICSVCWNKRELMEDERPHTLNTKTRLYHYTIRYLLERISWLCRDNAEGASPKCRLVFAKCKNLQYQEIEHYIRRLRDGDEDDGVRIHWQALDTDKLVIRQATELVGLQMADVAASGIYRGLELGPHGRTEPTYARHLRGVTYKRRGNYFKYGLKIMPRIPAIEPQYDNRYDWIAEYQ